MAADTRDPPAASAVASAPALVARVDRASLRYRKVLALDDITLALPAGRLVGLIGPDGAGKSSLLALIAGARRMQAGEIEVLGGSMRDRLHRDDVCTRIAYMPQGLGRNLYAGLSVYENVDFFGRLFGIEPAERHRRIETLLRATGIGEFPDRPAGKLSGGMKQKLGACCALIHEPDLLILDEPTTGVDPLSRRQFWELIARMRRQRPGMSVLVATAYYEEAEKFDLLVAMNGGRVLEVGTPAEFLVSQGGASLEMAFARLLDGAGQASHERFRRLPRVSDGRGPAIEAQGLTRRFGEFLAVDGIDLRIERGEIFGFLGPNGCGKTTTMKMLTGLLPASSGTASLFGQPVDVQDLDARRRVGFMSQSFSLYTELSVRQNLRLHARLYRVPSETIGKRLEEVIEQFDLREHVDMQAEHLPLGVRQRLSLAVAMIHEPELLILDEPTSGVDPIARDRFWDLLIELAHGRGVTIFLSTHFMNEAGRCDRISLMYEGRVLAQGAPEAIVEGAGAANLEEAFVRLLEGKIVAAPASSEVLPDTPSHASKPARRGDFAWHRLWAYARREALEIWRDRIRLAFATLGPVLLMIVFGFGITFDVEDLAYAALDFDRSSVSREYLESFAGSRYFSLHAPAKDAEDLEQRMRSGELRFAIEIPPGFGRDLMRGRTPEVAVWLDGAFPFRAETTRGYVMGVHQAYLDRLAGHSARARTGAVADVEARFRYNQDFRSVYAMVPGIVMLLLMFIPAIMTSLAIVREKELGSIVNFYVTPTSRLEYLLGKQLPYVGIALLNFVMLMVLALTVFRMTPKGSFATYCVGAVLYTITSTGIGLLVANFVRTQIAAIIAAAILTTLPATQYSGFMLPVSSLSLDAQVIGRAFPSTYFLHMSVGVFNKALELAPMVFDLVALTVIAVVVTMLARAALSEQES